MKTRFVVTRRLGWFVVEDTHPVARKRGCREACAATERRVAEAQASMLNKRREPAPCRVFGGGR